MPYIIAALLILCVIAYIASTGSRMERQKEKVIHAEATIDSTLHQQHCHTEKLADLAKEFLPEQADLFDVISLRSDMSLSQKAEAGCALERYAKQIGETAKTCPRLASQMRFTQLQRSVEESQLALQEAWRMYNANISQLNRMIVSFPGNVVADMKGIHLIRLFKMESANCDTMRLEA